MNHKVYVATDIKEKYVTLKGQEINVDLKGSDKFIS